MSTEKKCQTFDVNDRVRIALSEDRIKELGLTPADVGGVYVIRAIQRPGFISAVCGVSTEVYYAVREDGSSATFDSIRVTCCQIEKVPVVEPSCALSRQPSPLLTLCNECDKSPIPTDAGDDGDEFDSDLDDDSDIDDDSEDDLFVVGDTVRLASGGPSMTITSIDDKTKIASCDYYSFNDYKFKRERFPLSCLIFADD